MSPRQDFINLRPPVRQGQIPRSNSRSKSSLRSKSKNKGLSLVDLEENRQRPDVHPDLTTFGKNSLVAGSKASVASRAKRASARPVAHQSSRTSKAVESSRPKLASGKGRAPEASKALGVSRKQHAQTSSKASTLKLQNINESSASP